MRKRKKERAYGKLCKTAFWVMQQIRNATPFGKQPKYLLHDNDAIFRASLFQWFLENCGTISKRTSYHNPWQNGICERLIGIVRRKLFDHIIPLNQRHLERLLAEYVDYYNTIHTHQALDGETPVPSLMSPKTLMSDMRLSAKPILDGLYHGYQKVA